MIESNASSITLCFTESLLTHLFIWNHDEVGARYVLKLWKRHTNYTVAHEVNRSLNRFEASHGSSMCLEVSCILFHVTSYTAICALLGSAVEYLGRDFGREQLYKTFLMRCLCTLFWFVKVLIWKVLWYDRLLRFCWCPWLHLFCHLDCQWWPNVNHVPTLSSTQTLFALAPLEIMAIMWM